MEYEVFDRIIAALNKSIVKIKEEAAEIYIRDNIERGILKDGWDDADITEAMDNNNTLFHLNALSEEVIILKVKEMFRSYELIKKKLTNEESTG